MNFYKTETLSGFYNLESLSRFRIRFRWASFFRLQKPPKFHTSAASCEISSAEFSCYSPFKLPCSFEILSFFVVGTDVGPTRVGLDMISSRDEARAFFDVAKVTLRVLLRMVGVNLTVIYYKY